MSLYAGERQLCKFEWNFPVSSKPAH